MPSPVSEGGRKARLRLLERTHAQLQAESTALRARLAAIESEMYELNPVQSLPDDVLAIIFEMVYQHRFPYCRRYEGHMRQSPITLTHVCRRWRGVALSLSSLWNCLHIFTNVIDSDLRSAKKSEVLKALLLRSGQRKLSITLSCFDGQDGAVELWRDFRQDGWCAFSACLSRLLQEHNRWQHCAIFSSYEQVMNKIQVQLMRYDYPSLEYLQLFLCATAPADRLPNEFALIAPRLAHYHAHVVPTILRSTSTDQLVELKLSEVTIDARQFMSVLAALAPSLRTLTLDSIDLYPATPSPEPATTIWSRLNYLALSYCLSSFQAGRLVEAIATLLRNSPALDTFICVGDKLPEVQILLSMTQVALTTVRTLAINATFASEDERTLSSWRAVVRAFPSVTNVDLEGGCAIGYLQILNEANTIGPAGGPLLCPFLHTILLSIETEEQFECALKLVHGLIKARRPLEVVNFRNADSSDNWTPNHPLYEFATSGTSVQWIAEKSLYNRLAFRSWDTELELPVFSPWDGTLEFEDQFGGM